jgi:predicted unusual protein kinase regulating ubiquinone biosynthesis (AarF/ABC1/UbiB family)
MIKSRYRRIVFFFSRVLLWFAWWELVLPRVGLRARALQTRSERMRRSAAAFRLLAIDMGGVLIKVGQFFSTRVDILPREVISELEGLQDEVPPVPFQAVRQAAEDEYGVRLEEKFARFEAQPLAAASLGQAHRAWIHPPVEDSGSSELLAVVVKVQRPQIETIINTDLAALRTVGQWLQRYRPISRRANIPALLGEFTRILYQEIDYLAEGQNAETFASNFADAPVVRVPQIIWSHTTRRVLTLENVWAIKITDYEAISASGVDRAAVASRLFNTYLKQIFEDGFFHADPHPGNLFVQPLQDKELSNGSLPEESSPSTPWQLTFVDFGMVGHVPPRLQEGLREMLIGVGTKDPARVIKSYQLLGVLLPNADLSLLEKAESELFNRYWGKTMTELREIPPEEVRSFMYEFRDLLYTLPFQMPQDLIFMGRALAILSGMCTGLDPNFNPWDHISPYAQKVIAQEARTGADAILQELGDFVRSLVAVPKKMDALLTRVDRGEVAVRAPEISAQVSHMELAIRQVAGGIIFAAFLLGGIQLLVSGLAPFGQILLGGAALSLLWVILSGFRRR